MIKYYMTTEDGLRKLKKFVEKCNAPDGMTKKEMMGEFGKILLSEQINIGDIILGGNKNGTR